MPDKYFVDTNILIYAHDRSASLKHDLARQLLESTLDFRARLSFWDALILQAAESAGAAVLYSENLAPGQKYGPIQVINPVRQTQVE